MIAYAPPRLVIGRWADGWPEGEGLPVARYPPPPQSGAPGKVSPPHVTRHGRCFSPAPLNC